MQTMYPGKVNSPATVLDGGINDVITTINVINGSVLPAAPNIAVIGTDEDAETILYTTRVGNVLSNVTRGFQGIAKAWSSGEAIARLFTEYDYGALKGNIEEVVVVAGVLTGSIIAYGAAAAPEDWLLCDGTAVSRSTYSDLFEIIGTTYGVGDGSTTFNVPNLKGRIPVGLDSGQSEFDALAETGGAKTRTLTEVQIPAHTHTVDAKPGSGAGTYAATSPIGGSGSFTTDSTGGGEAHNNLQPYLIINYIIKT